MADHHLAPVHRAGVYFEEMDDEAVVYGRTGKRAIHLNETATVVWKLCDGERTVADIAALLTREYPASADEIAEGVAKAVDQMVAARMMSLARPLKTTEKMSPPE
jgi:pyrroloquinoline quinone biosynthesis protein D